MTPTRWSAPKGREAFEQRLASALPLSEYLVREVSTDIDLSHADGRARFAEAARPLVAKLAHGLYRELVLERIAATIKLSAERLQELWSAGRRASARGAVTHAERSRTRHQRGTRQSRAPGDRAPAAVSGDCRARQRCRSARTLDRLHEPGIELLRELIDDLKRTPGADFGASHRALGRPAGARVARETSAEGGSHYRCRRRRRRIARRARQAGGACRHSAPAGA